MQDKSIERSHGADGSSLRIYVDDGGGDSLSHEENMLEILRDQASTRVKKPSSSASEQQTIKSAPQPQVKLSPQVQERKPVQTVKPVKQSYGSATLTTKMQSSQIVYSESPKQIEELPEDVPKPRGGDASRGEAQLDPIPRVINPNATVESSGDGGEDAGGENSGGGGPCDGTCCVHTLNELKKDVVIIVDDTVVKGSPALNEYYKFATDGQTIRLVKVKDTILSLNALDRNVTIDGKTEGGIKVETKEEGRRIELSAYWV